MDVLCSQSAIKKNNPRKFLKSVGDGEEVEFDVIQGTKVSVTIFFETLGQKQSCQAIRRSFKSLLKICKFVCCEFQTLLTLVIIQLPQQTTDGSANENTAVKVSKFKTYSNFILRIVWSCGSLIVAMY